jgi:hypothetical protein
MGSRGPNSVGSLLVWGSRIRVRQGDPSQATQGSHFSCTAADAMAAPLPDRPLMPLKEYLPILTDGNAFLVMARLQYSDVISILGLCTAHLLKEEHQKAMTDIFENKEWDGPKKGIKADMLLSKLYLQATKQRGFKSGVDVKKLLREIDDYQYAEDYLDDEKADMISKMIVTHPTRRLAAPCTLRLCDRSR